MDQQKQLSRVIRLCLRAHAFASRLDTPAVMRSIELTIACAESASGSKGRGATAKA